MKIRLKDVILERNNMNFGHDYVQKEETLEKRRKNMIIKMN